MENEEIKKFNEYFEEDLKAIEEELAKSKEYSKIIDAQIETLSSQGPLGPNKGGQHYLIEHIANAVQLQTQRQGLRKDRFAIKKAILDYANKAAEKNDNKNVASFADMIDMLSANNKPNGKAATSKTLDEIIDSSLEGNDGE